MRLGNTIGPETIFPAATTKGPLAHVYALADEGFGEVALKRDEMCKHELIFHRPWGSLGHGEREKERPESEAPEVKLYIVSGRASRKPVG